MAALPGTVRADLQADRQGNEQIGCLYRMNDTAFGLKSSSFATSLNDVASFRLASLDLDMLQEARVTHRCSYAIVMRTMGICMVARDAGQHTLSHLFQMPRNMAQNPPMSRSSSTTQAGSRCPAPQLQVPAVARPRNQLSIKSSSKYARFQTRRTCQDPRLSVFCPCWVSLSGLALADTRRLVRVSPARERYSFASDSSSSAA